MYFHGQFRLGNNKRTRDIPILGTTASLTAGQPLETIDIILFYYTELFLIKRSQFIFQIFLFPFWVWLILPHLAAR